ncbi:MAG TPA: hypothetical protein DCF47_03365, partial [Kandleria vitulina]|nr:hypothetical protein [Kandleria vitulina]HBG68030.1 hypothetical protein [Kandleria vitulina]
VQLVLQEEVRRQEAQLEALQDRHQELHLVAHLLLQVQRKDLHQLVQQHKNKRELSLFFYL